MLEALLGLRDSAPDHRRRRSMLANLAMEMVRRKSRIALSMVRTPQILDRLHLMENLKANSRLGFGNKSAIDLRCEPQIEDPIQGWSMTIPLA